MRHATCDTHHATRRCSSSVRDLNLNMFHVRAPNGLPGGGKCQKGSNGAQVVVHVPVGTVVKLFKRSPAAAAAAAAAAADADGEGVNEDWQEQLRGRRELSADDARAHLQDVDAPTAFDAAVAASAPAGEALLGQRVMCGASVSRDTVSSGGGVCSDGFKGKCCGCLLHHY